MEAQTHRPARRRRRKKPQVTSPAPVETIFIAARRPGSPRLEKPTRRMKAASAKPKNFPEELLLTPQAPSVEEAPLTPKKREVRIVQRKQDELDETERMRLRLLDQFLASEGRAAITRAAETYLSAGFTFPREQEPQLKLLEHFDEERARGALAVLSELLRDQSPRQLPLLRQRLRRLEDHADEPSTRAAAADLFRILPA